MCCNVAASSLPADYATVFEMFLIHFDAIYGVNRFNKPFIILFYFLFYCSPRLIFAFIPLPSTVGGLVLRLTWTIYILQSL